MTGLARIAACGLAVFGLWGSIVYAVDDPPTLMPGRVAIVRVRPIGDGLVKVVALPPAGFLFALPSAGHEPTAPGAVNTLDVFDTVPPGAGADTYALPVVGWVPLGAPPVGYKYKGTGLPGDPCRIVIVKHRVVKAVCRGLGVTLTPPIAGTLGIDLTLGTPDPVPALSLQKKYCAEFGGLFAVNVPGKFVAKLAPAPLICP